MHTCEECARGRYWVKHSICVCWTWLVCFVVSSTRSLSSVSLSVHYGASALTSPTTAVKLLLYFSLRYWHFLAVIRRVNVYNWRIFLLYQTFCSCVMPFASLALSLLFRRRLVWCWHGHSCFPLVVICTEYPFPPSSFNLFWSLNLKWVSGRQHRVGLCVFVYSANLKV